MTICSVIIIMNRTDHLQVSENPEDAAVLIMALKKRMLLQKEHIGSLQVHVYLSAQAFFQCSSPIFYSCFAVFKILGVRLWIRIGSRLCNETASNKI